MKPLCIYHGHCADGFTAAWAVYRARGIEADFHAGIYGKPPPDVIGRDVIMVDFSYKRPVLDAMAELARSILILDHHKSAAEDLAGFGLGSRPHRTLAEWADMEEKRDAAGYGDMSAADAGAIASLFDMDRSGAGIAWDFFHPNVPRPLLVDYVEDRDLWRFRLQASREVNAYVFAHEYTWENWDRLAMALSDESGVGFVASMGAAIERKHHKDVRELVAVCRRRMMIASQQVWGASLPYTLTSDAGNLMAQGEPFAACYWDTPNGRVFSLRSTEGGADVSLIAKTYGGGGHKHASGFTVPLNRIAEFETPE